MEITQGQAKEALGDVENVSRAIKGKLAYGIAGPIITLWGLVWITCFLVTQFIPRIASWAWLGGNILGIAGSLYLGRFRRQAKAVQSQSARRVGWRLFWFWLLLFIFGDIWLALLWPWRAEQLGAFLVTLVMFAYVVMGLWLELRFMVWLGLAVTGVAVGGYVMSLFFPGYLSLWLGLAGGSALLGSGLYLTLRWR